MLAFMAPSLILYPDKITRFSEMVVTSIPALLTPHYPSNFSNDKSFINPVLFIRFHTLPITTTFFLSWGFSINSILFHQLEVGVFSHTLSLSLNCIYKTLLFNLKNRRHTKIPERARRYSQQRSVFVTQDLM